jgi:outer membrane protein
LALIVASVWFALPIAASQAETIGGALVKAYFSNPDINQQRTAVRASDENVPKATAGYRPTVSAEADASVQQTNANEQGTLITPGSASVFSRPRGYGLTVNQTLWNGNRTFNSVRQAESGVMAARETLRNTEQNVLLDGADEPQGKAD